MQPVGVGVGSEIVVVLEIEVEGGEVDMVDDMVGEEPETQSTCPTIKSQVSSKLGLNEYKSICEIPNRVQIA